jgi:hypothetical protein
MLENTEQLKPELPLPDPFPAIKEQEQTFLTELGAKLPDGGFWRIQKAPEEDKPEEELIQIIPLPPLEQDSAPDADLVKPYLLVHYQRVLGREPTIVSICEVRATAANHTYAERAARYVGEGRPENCQYALSVLPIWDEDTKQPDITKNRLKTIQRLNRVLSVETGDITQQSALAKIVLDETLNYQQRSKALRQLRRNSSDQLLTEAVLSRLYQAYQKSGTEEVDKEKNVNYQLFKECSGLEAFLDAFAKNLGRIPEELTSHVRNQPISGPLLIEELGRIAADLRSQVEKPKEAIPFKEAERLKSQSDSIFAALLKAFPVEKVLKNLDLTAIPAEALEKAVRKLDNRTFAMVALSSYSAEAITMAFIALSRVFLSPSIQPSDIKTILGAGALSGIAVVTLSKKSIEQSPRYKFLEGLRNKILQELDRRQSKETAT